MYPPVSQLASRLRPLDLGDTIGKAAERIRSSTAGAAPVCISGRVLGLITGADLAVALDGRAEDARRLPLGVLTPRAVPAIPDYWSADHALNLLRREALPAAPVVDAAGRYVGMVTVADLATAVCRRLRPKSIGGMATPFGVYLTDGTVRGGVGDAALVSAGVFIGGIQVLAMLLTDQLSGLATWLGSVPEFGFWLLQGGRAYLDTSLFFLVFALLFRLSWVSGFHAAEHQVVHAIEGGEDLKVAVVRAKPRVHPRCGTNLVVGLVLISMLWNWSPPANFREFWPIAGIALFMLTWRRIGSFAQHWITTRPATDAQIRNGIRAGEQLLSRYQESLQLPHRIWRRIWNMGICQVFAGYAVLVGLLFLVGHLFGITAFSSLW